MVTLLGFFCILINIIIMLIFDPDLNGPDQTWIYFSYAAGVWAYSTMDNIDGKQARRTGTSSGLGELFDHGIDSLNCTLASLLETSAMGLGPTYVGVVTALIPTLPMFFSTWETYHTHTLFLGYINGPTEGLMIAAALMIASGTWGPQIYHEPLANVFGHEDVLGSLAFKDIWAVVLIIALGVAHLPSCVINVAEARRAKNLPVLPLLLEWTPMLVFCAALAAWLGSPYSSLLANNHLSLLCFTLSFVFGRMTTKTILAHLTRQPYPYWTGQLAPLVGGAIAVNLPFLGLPAIFTPQIEFYFLAGYFVIAAIVYFRWAYLVIDAVCDYLGISCLTIPQEKWKLAEEAVKAERQQRTRGLSHNLESNGADKGKKI